jgi:protein gp37
LSKKESLKMPNKTKIEWTEQTWNPSTGCTKISAGCKNCYAEQLAVRLRAMGTEGYDNGFTFSTVANGKVWQQYPKIIK